MGGRGGSENGWRVLFVLETFWFFSFIFLVEVLKVELTGLTDRTHSGSVLHMVQAMISEKSRGGGSTQNDLLVLVLKSEFLATPEKQHRGALQKEVRAPGGPAKPGASVFHMK